MQKLGILLFALVSPAARADSLETFAQNFVTALNAEAFDGPQLCSKFWEQSQKETCERSIPWAYVRTLAPALQKSVATAHPDASFLAIHLGTTGTLLLTASRQNGDWRASLDLKGVWDAYSQSWSSDAEPFEARFAEPIEDEKRRALEARIHSFHAEIAKSLGLPAKPGVPFYFQNSARLAEELGQDFPKFISGGARDGFVLIVGDPSVGMWSTLFHELVHTYTAFPGDFWDGKGFFPNAAFSEGLATVFQMKKVWGDNLPPPLTAQYLCKDIQIAERLPKADLFQLLDDDFFRHFDGQGYHPAYLGAAAIVGPLFASMTPEAFKAFWNKIGSASTALERKSLLLTISSEKEIRAAWSAYMDDLRKQMLVNANFVCPRGP